MATQVEFRTQLQVAHDLQTTTLVSLYVGDIDKSVSDSQLLDLFGQIGEVVSGRICRDLNGMSLGYGYVNYRNIHNAERALEELNFIPLNGKPIRVMYSNRDPAVRRSNNGNIFVKNLDKEIDNGALYETFSTYGNILSCKVATNLSGQSKGYGYVQYDSVESARLAIEKLNGELLNGKTVYVGPLVRKEEREMTANRSTFTNVFVKNLSESVTEDDLKKIFGEFGSITSTVVMKNEDGTSKCFGFVNFENPDDAARAVESLNGKIFYSKAWFVGKALMKSEREMELSRQSEQAAEDVASNLYVKNLNDSIDDDKLKDLFSPFGSVTSCKVEFLDCARKLTENTPHRNEFGYAQHAFPGIRQAGPLMPAMSQPIPSGALASALANSPANEQTTMLGENLYPLVERLEPENAGKVTGMLLEMGKTEILHLLESPEALEAKVSEAMEVLRTESDTDPTEKLASLSLNEWGSSI